MFGIAKIRNSNVWNSQNSYLQCLEKPNPEFQFLKKLNLAIPMFGKANLQISNVWKRQNPDFQCLEKPKLRISVCGRAKFQNFNVS